MFIFIRIYGRFNFNKNVWVFFFVFVVFCFFFLLRALMCDMQINTSPNMCNDEISNRGTT